MSKLLSVLIPAYKADLWLKESVESVLMQDVPDGWEIEVLVGVDGCTPTLAVAKELVGHRVTVLNCPRNRGVYITLNTLISASSGDAFVAHGADDVLKQGRLERMLNTLDSLSDVSLVNTFAYKADSDMSNAKKVSRAHDGIWLWRREAWCNHIGGYRPWRCGGDSDTLDRAKHLGLRSHIVPEHLYVRRIHSDQLTSKAETRSGSVVRVAVVQYLTSQKKRMAAGEPTTFVTPIIHKKYTTIMQEF